MLSTSTQAKLKDIVNRISSGQEVSLDERILATIYADKDQAIMSSLKKAQRKQQNPENSDEIETLLNDLAIGPDEPNSHFSSKDEDLGEWFSGAPSWLGRS